MSGEAQHSDGRRTVGLYMPFQSAGTVVKEITFQPCTFGHLLRWQAGKLLGSVALMRDLTGLEFHILEAIRHPDDERVMRAFLDHIHPQIAEDIRNGVMHLAAEGQDHQGGPDAPVRAEPLAPDYPEEWDARPDPSLAQDPLSRYSGFEPAPETRPVDHVPGLDP